MEGLAGLTLEVVPKGNSDAKGAEGLGVELDVGAEQNTPGPQNQRGEGRQGRRRRKREAWPAG